MVVNWSIQQSGRKQTNEMTFFFYRMSSDVEAYKARYARKGREKSRGKGREKLKRKL